MTTRERGLLSGAVLTIALILTVPSLVAQLQQSGGPGSTVTIGAALPAGAALLGKTGIDQTTDGTTNKVYVGNIPHVIVDTNATTAVTGTFWQATQPVSGTFYQATQPISIAATVKTAPATTCGVTAVSQALAAVPTSSTAVFSSTTCLIAAFFENSNASAQTVTLTDNAGTPLNAVGPAFSVPGLSNMTIPLYGIPFTTGVKWAAGGTGVLGGMVGFQ